MIKEGVTFEKDGLIIRVTHVYKTSLLVFRGASDIRDGDEFLNPFFKDILPSLLDQEVTLDFTNLEYLSSATLSPLMQFIKKLDSHKLQTKLIFTSTKEWQRVTVRLMRVMVRSLSNVQVAVK